MEKIIVDANKMVPVMNHLLKEGYDIWENDPYYQGYGFKVILKDTWIEVRMSYYETEPSKFHISLYKKHDEHRNMLDSFLCKTLKKVTMETTDTMYKTIKEMISE